jgi:hypothetical protein
MVWECVYIYERLLKIHLPELNAHFDEEGVAAGTYAPQYFITVFLVCFFDKTFLLSFRFSLSPLSFFYFFISQYLFFSTICLFRMCCGYGMLFCLPDMILFSFYC